jgi:DNA-binding MurR/RpiR family transcriptional regulator
MVALCTMLRTIYPNLSPGQRRVADFLSEHLDEAQFLTARQMGARCDFSEAGVVRFAQLLGFSGYPELRRAVRDEFRISATPTTQMMSARFALADEPDLVEGIARRDATLIGDTAARLDLAVLERCAARLVSANEIYVLGHRASHSMAEYFATALRQGIGVGLPLSFGTGMAYDVIASAHPRSVVVAVSITPYAPQTLEILRAAAIRGLHRIAITDHPLGAPARLADEVILFETEIQAFTSSYVGVLTIFHILLALVSRDSGARMEGLLTIRGAFDASRIPEQNGAHRAPGGIGVRPISGAMSSVRTEKSGKDEGARWCPNNPPVPPVR